MILAFSAFVGTLELVSKNKNQSGLVPATSAHDGEDDGDSGGDNNQDQNDNQDNNVGDNNQNENKYNTTESAKKQAERERETAKKQAEREWETSNRQAELSKKNSESDNFSGDQKNDQNDNQDDNQGDSENNGSETERDGNNGEDNGMFKDRNKTLEKLQEQIAEAEKKILEKQGEGADVTTALARLTAAKADMERLGSLFDVNNLDVAKLLAKQIQKTAHFTEKDIQFSEKISEELDKIERRFGQVDKKIAVLQSLGGDTSSFQTQLASLRTDFGVLKNSVAVDPAAITRETIRAFENRVKRLKSLVESAMFAYGGTEDDDLVKDHDEETNELSDDLNDVAEVENGDDNGVSVKVRKIAAEHKAQAQTVRQSLEDIHDRGGFTRVFFGPNFSAIDTLGEQVAAMQARATTLSSLAAQMTDPDIKKLLSDQAEALQSEALKLQSYITAENGQFSILGGLLKLFR